MSSLHATDVPHWVSDSCRIVSVIVEPVVSIVSESTGTGGSSTYVLSLPSENELHASVRSACRLASVPLVTAAEITAGGSVSRAQNASLVPAAELQPKSAGKSVVMSVSSSVPLLHTGQPAPGHTVSSMVSLGDEQPGSFG